MLAIWLQVAIPEPTFAGLRKNKKQENKGSQKKGSPEKKGKGVSFGKA